eukprot:6212858-Pleurochrysis_carterae.AAC.1
MEAEGFHISHATDFIREHVSRGMPNFGWVWCAGQRKGDALARAVELVTELPPREGVECSVASVIGAREGFDRGDGPCQSVCVSEPNVEPKRSLRTLFRALRLAFFSNLVAYVNGVALKIREDVDDRMVTLDEFVHFGRDRDGDGESAFR